MDGLLLAHTIGAGGPDLEMTLLAGGLLVLGLVFFFQKTVKSVVSVVLLVGALAVGAGAFAVGGSTDEPLPAPDVEVRIVSPEDGATVPARNEVEVRAEVIGGTLTDAERSEDPTEGHLHVFVDDAMVSMPVSEASPVTLEPGTHVITVEFTSADHRSYEPRILDRVAVTAE